VSGEIQQPPLWVGAEASPPGDCSRVLPLLQHCSAGGRLHNPGSWPTYPPSSPHLIHPLPATLMACFSCWQQCHNYTECAGLHCSRYFGKPASVNNWRLCDAYPGDNVIARVRVAQRVLGRPVTRWQPYGLTTLALTPTTATGTGTAVAC